MSELVEKAQKIATDAHAGQTRINGEAYINHPRRVAEAVQHLPEVFQAVAWLHDVVEDTDITIEHLRDLGIPSAVLRGVACLTRREDEKYSEFIERCSLTRLTRVVKYVDIQDNLRDIDTYKPRLSARYQKAAAHLLSRGEVY